MGIWTFYNPEIITISFFYKIDFTLDMKNINFSLRNKGFHDFTLLFNQSISENVT